MECHPKVEFLRARKLAHQARGSTHYMKLMEALKGKCLEFKVYKEMLDSVDRDTMGQAKEESDNPIGPWGPS